MIPIKRGLVSAIIAGGAAVPAPLASANDLCADAITVSGDDVVTGSVVGAVADGSATCDTSTNPDVWYVFSAPVSGVLTVTTCGTNDAPGLDRGMDTIISVHEGCPDAGSVELACNDNWFAAGVGDACAAQDAGVRADSAVSVGLSAAQTVVIRVTYKLGFIRDGAFVLNVAFEPAVEPCPCERDGVDGVDVFDLLAYLGLWFVRNPGADFDGSGGVDVFDLLAFLGCWFPASAGSPCP